MHGSHDLFETVPNVLVIMNQCALATGLQLNSKKTVVVFMGGFQESYVRDRFDELEVDLGRICIRTCGKYPGIFLGRGGGEVSWRDPMVKYVRR
eukprot:5057686-Pyramimonas_sp.AAC.1